MFVLVRVWGQMMPSHSYFYSMSWAVGFIPMFIILLIFRRKYFNEQRSELDANWPMIKQSVFVAFTYAVNYWGVSTSAPHVTGPAQVIFSQVPTVAAAIFTVIAF
jgi:subtilisin family serine protease